MIYQKKVIVLKQVEEGFCPQGKCASGIARIERENDNCDFYLSVINLNTLFSGEYFLFVFGQQDFCFSESLGPCPRSIVKQLYESDILFGDFAVAIAYIKDNLPTTVCFGKSEGCLVTLHHAKKIIAEKCLAKIKQDKKLAPVTQQPCPPVYDDEAVATENYFETEMQLNGKLTTLKEIVDERLQTENELPYNQSQTQTQKDQICFDCNQNEIHPCNETLPQYYLTVKSKLDNLFEKFPTVPQLEQLFPQSRWAKIHFSFDNHYVVGEVKEDGVVKYICYGVPSKTNGQPPPTLKDFCSFVPLCPFNPNQEGYWMAFQDACSGKSIPCIKE